MALVVVASVGACDSPTDEGQVDPGCASFDEATCVATEPCSPIRASAVPDGERVFVGCRFSTGGCGTTVGCGYPTDGNGACMYFYEDCVPKDWTFEGTCSGQPDCAQFERGLGGAGGAN